MMGDTTASFIATLRIVLLLCAVIVGGGVSAQMYSDSISVNFFLIDECRISESMTGEINYIHQHYDKAPFHFVGYFPKRTSTEDKIQAFVQEYQLEMPFFTDYELVKTEFYGATIGPEVVVYDERLQRVLYRGRIDDSYYRLGVRRRVVKAKDLRNALDAILNQVEITSKETKAIGCYLQ